MTTKSGSGVLQNSNRNDSEVVALQPQISIPYGSRTLRPDDPLQLTFGL
jgi:hypothetical protein